MMRSLRTYISAAAIATALLVAACGNSETQDATAETETLAAETAESTAPVERASKEAMLATFDAALEKAKATEGPGAPAMWTLSDEDTTVYLFGTVHLLRPDLEWRTDAFNAAVSSADKIVFEVDMKSEAAQSAIMTDFVGRGMFQDGRTLKGVLEDSDEAIISAAFDSVGLPIDAMNTFEPWMASMNLGIMKLVNDGYDPNAGVEMVIEEEAAAAGKSFGYLETISQQADAFDLLPEQDQIAMLYETALLLDESPRMLDLLVSEWAEGDLEGISALVYNPDGGGFTEAAYESVLVKRNEAWVPQIEAMLDEPGIVFIAVGAGHLAGPDSVVTMLRDKGYTIEGP